MMSVRYVFRVWRYIVERVYGREGLKTKKLNDSKE